MGSALVFPLSENGVSLKVVGTPYDRDVIDECIRTGRNPKLTRPFPAGISYHTISSKTGGKPFPAPTS